WCRRSQVSGGVAWLRKRRRGRWGSERRSTFTTEFSGGPDLSAAARTGPHERGATLLAELGSHFILKPAARTAHRASLLLQALQYKETARALILRRQSSAVSSSSAPRPHTVHRHRRQGVAPPL